LVPLVSVIVTVTSVTLPPESLKVTVPLTVKLPAFVTNEADIERAAGQSLAES
jgi:hypothetical protein